MVDAMQDANDAGTSLGMADAGAQGQAGMLSDPKEAACGVVGKACCQPGNTCDSGACLRGLCSAYGGLYGQDRGCGTSVCTARNAYTAGCSCPAGFTALAAVDVPRTCDDGGVGSTALVLCTTGASGLSSWMGLWVQEQSTASCADSCLVPNASTSECSCPAGSQALSARIEEASQGCAGGGKTLALCVDPKAAAANFRGAYVLGLAGTARACVANPVTGSCTCPTGSSAN